MNWPALWLLVILGVALASWASTAYSAGMWPRLGRPKAKRTLLAVDDRNVPAPVQKPRISYDYLQKTLALQRQQKDFMEAAAKSMRAAQVASWTQHAGAGLLHDMCANQHWMQSPLNAYQNPMQSPLSGLQSMFCNSYNPYMGQHGLSAKNNWDGWL